MDQRYPGIGFSAEETATPSEFLLDSHTIEKGVTIDSAARDAGNTGKTTTLRPGLVVGKVTATGKCKQYDASATDGTETAVGILKDQVKVVDGSGNAVDANDAVLVIHGRVDESALIGCDVDAKADLAGQIIFD